MKKTTIVMAAVMTICLLVNSAVVFAADNASGNALKGNNPEQRLEKIQEKVQNIKNWNQEIKPLLEQARSGRVEIIRLRSQLLNMRGQLESKIQQLRQQKDNLTDDQIAQLKACLEAIKADKTGIKDTLGGIHSQLPGLRGAKKDQDLEKAKAALQEIIKVQQERINLLNKGIADLQKVLAI
ncbi:MAG: hypothetical protein GX434_02950 [Peptococcaceae bacterium]|nr:hypothetical protein [Peptococcaceae bacterium]